jgi:hypothetical protein
MNEYLGENKKLSMGKTIKGPIGVRVHLTGDQEMGMEATGYGGRVGN